MHCDFEPKRRRKKRRNGEPILVIATLGSVPVQYPLLVMVVIVLCAGPSSVHPICANTTKIANDFARVVAVIRLGPMTRGQSSSIETRVGTMPEAVSLSPPVDSQTTARLLRAIKRRQVNDSNPSEENSTSVLANEEQLDNDSAQVVYESHGIEVKWILTCVYLIIFLIGVIGNVCNCLVIADGRNRYMKTATNYYLFSLSVSDLLLLIFGLPHDLVNLWHHDSYLFGQFVCIARGWISEASTNASVLVIVAFTVERYLAICHPLKAQTLSRLSRSIKIIISIWLIASSCALIVVMQLGLKTDHLEGQKPVTSCTIIALNETIFELSVLIFFIIPMAVLVILYIRLGYHLRKKSRLICKSRKARQQHLRAAVTTDLNTTSLAVDTSPALKLSPSQTGPTRSALNSASATNQYYSCASSTGAVSTISDASLSPSEASHISGSRNSTVPSAWRQPKLQGAGCCTRLVSSLAVAVKKPNKQVDGAHCGGIEKANDKLGAEKLASPPPRQQHGPCDSGTAEETQLCQATRHSSDDQRDDSNRTALCPRSSGCSRAEAIADADTNAPLCHVADSLRANCRSKSIKIDGFVAASAAERDRFNKQPADRSSTTQQLQSAAEMSHYAANDELQTREPLAAGTNKLSCRTSEPHYNLSPIPAAALTSTTFKTPNSPGEEAALPVAGLLPSVVTPDAATEADDSATFEWQLKEERRHDILFGRVAASGCRLSAPNAANVAPQAANSCVQVQALHGQNSLEAPVHHHHHHHHHHNNNNNNNHHHNQNHQASSTKITLNSTVNASNMNSVIKMLGEYSLFLASLPPS